jgi:hypothetical protein
MLYVTRSNRIGLKANGRAIMANTQNYKVKIEKWFREKYLSKKYPRCDISAGPIPLIWGGKFEYDARVMKDGKLQAVYCLSCSDYKTTSGNGGAGKFNKIQGDMLKMLGTKCLKKVLTFTGPTMLAKVRAEQKSGRLPPDIQCELIALPYKFSAVVHQIRADSVKEVTPKKKKG